MTARTPNNEIRPTDLLVISPTDAEQNLIEEGETVRLKSRYGEIPIPVLISPQVKAGELFATFHNPQVFLNLVTNPNRARFVQAPECKVTAVRIEKLTDICSGDKAAGEGENRNE